MKLVDRFPAAQSQSCLRNVCPGPGHIVGAQVNRRYWLQLAHRSMATAEGPRRFALWLDPQAGVLLRICFVLVLR